MYNFNSGDIMYEKLAKKYNEGSYYISESLPASRSNSLRKKKSIESAGQNGLYRHRKNTNKIDAIWLCFLRHTLNLCPFNS